MATNPTETNLHEADLRNFFHTVTHFGAATARVVDFMRWMNWVKQAPGFWAEVQERFHNTLDPRERGDGWRLFSLQSHGHITLLCFDPKNTEAQDCWWQPVLDLAERPSPGRRKQTVVDG